MAIHSKTRKPLGKKPRKKLNDPRRPIGNKPIETTPAETQRADGQKNSIVSKPLDVYELSQEALYTENRSKLEVDPAKKKHYAEKAKSLRRLVSFLKAIGWDKKSAALNSELHKDIREIR